ncbi:EcsC family protein [Bacillus suaedaesalsae]|uniref:EcsC family protein n=1 Tax=Bacillus suaedaesalsae TaxID=2810349 RepID=A0ABS2DGY4_9BACI|nr:EcsC family protein [Bacillus suaedaesalsae]MBM6617738.1 EcsC family protein [Bacillus suaedaesalsae]
METKEELLQQLKLIEKWENDQKGLWFWEKIGRLPFKLLDKITPAFVQKKIGVLLDELGQYIQSGGKYLVQEQQIVHKYQSKFSEEISTLDDISTVPLHVMNQVCLEVVQNRQNFATVQGASTGFGGIFTLSIDIPLLLGLSLKTLQEIAMIYGYDPNDPAERIFIVKSLQFASSDIVGKQAILNELTDFYHRSEHQNEMMSQLQGWREVIYTYRDQFGWKKLFQLIPVAGMIFGAFVNRSMISDISEAGTMLYQKRRIMDRLQNQ